MYKIEYARDDTLSTLAMWFSDKDLAIASACELIAAGFRVSKVDGPGFQMGRRALESHRRGSPSRDALWRSAEAARPLELEGAAVLPEAEQAR